MFYIFVENYTNYRSTPFFQYHAERGHYLYPFFQVDNVLVKLKFLFARLCGTLSIGARWIVIQPPSPPRSSGDYYEDRYPHVYDPYIDPYRPYIPERPKTRDIGDAYDGRS